MVSTTIDKWVEEGGKLIPKNLNVFQSLVHQAKKCIKQQSYKAAAAYAEMAAFYASEMHSGLFASHEFEQVLHKISQMTVHERSYSKKERAPLPGKVEKVLHVTTAVSSIGGHSRMLWRWIQQDHERSHSIVITRQDAQTQVPDILKRTVKRSGGRISVLNKKMGGLIFWANQLRRMAAQVDLVVLHIHSYDIIPNLAFSQKEKLPPIILLDHADHKFWLGVHISDLFVSLRESGMRLLCNGRGVEAERCELLPIIIEPSARLLTRSEAKLQLGIPADSILLLSVARAIKYKTIDGLSYADAHLPLLKRYEKVFLVVVGPDCLDDWAEAIHQTGGRIRVYAETPSTAIFYQAADIYVDSFPFASNTSLLEAGCYAVPLVTRDLYSQESEVLGADMPGLTGNLIKTRSIEEYTAVLSHLVVNENFRMSLGEATRKKIIETHVGNNWQQRLENIYTRALNIRKKDKPTMVTDQMGTREVNFLLPVVQGSNFNVDWVIQLYMRALPLPLRWHYWKKTHQSWKSRYSLGLLLPEWLYTCYLRVSLLLKSALNV